MSLHAVKPVVGSVGDDAALPLADVGPRSRLTAHDVGLLLVRAIVAVVFVYHGSQKLFGWFGGYGVQGTATWMGSVGIPFPQASALLAGSAEFFGGLALALGVAFRPAAAGGWCSRWPSPPGRTGPAGSPSRRAAWSTP